jgi:pSer/pThr/pTyr-binding forkhead associated (FHA) protein
VVVPLKTQSLLIGRVSRSRNIHPEIECPADIGVSRRQAQLTTDGQRWWVEDLQSANGTYVGAASGALPTDALPPGQRRELAQDDHIYVGAWTCIVVRRATPEEQAGQA